MDVQWKRTRRLAMITTFVALAACDGKADDDALIGKWATSEADCQTEWIALAEDVDARRVEWWRTTDEATGPLPWRSGSWELRDATIIMSFEHRVEHDQFLQTRIDEEIDETVQFDVRDVGEDELRLAATAGGFSPEALFLGGEEKLFVRCEQ